MSDAVFLSATARSGAPRDAARARARVGDGLYGPFAPLARVLGPSRTAAPPRLPRRGAAPKARR